VPFKVFIPVVLILSPFNWPKFIGVMPERLSTCSENIMTYVRYRNRFGVI